jgi:hypothetical protein
MTTNAVSESTFVTAGSAVAGVRVEVHALTAAGVETGYAGAYTAHAVRVRAAGVAAGTAVVVVRQPVDALVAAHHLAGGTAPASGVIGGAAEITMFYHPFQVPTAVNPVIHPVFAVCSLMRSAPAVLDALSLLVAEVTSETVIVSLAIVLLAFVQAAASGKQKNY